MSNLENVYFYLDNAKIHYCKIIAPLLLRFNIVYGSPYSPFIDMDEEYFALIKHFLRKTGEKKKPI